MLIWLILFVVFQLFQRTLKQFEKLIKRGAFIDQYKQQPIFKDNLDEFDNSKEVKDFYLIISILTPDLNWLFYYFFCNSFN